MTGPSRASCPRIRRYAREGPTRGGGRAPGFAEEAQGGGGGLPVVFDAANRRSARRPPPPPRLSPNHSTTRPAAPLTRTQSRDIHLDSFTLLFHGHELLADAKLELNYGR